MIQQSTLRAKAVLLAFFFQYLYLGLAYPNDEFNGYEIKFFYSKDPISFQKEVQNGWTTINTAVTKTSDFVTSCSGYSMFGGVGIMPDSMYYPGSQLLSTFQYTFSETIPPHDIAIFKMRYFIIDDWKSADFYGTGGDNAGLQIGILANAIGWFGESASSAGDSNFCGDVNYPDMIVDVMGWWPDTDTSPLVYQLQAGMQSSSLYASIGFAEVTIAFKNDSSVTGSFDTYWCERGTNNERTFLPGNNGTTDGFCPCPQGQYQDSSSVCQPCDPSCIDCWDAGAANCIDCKVGYSRFENGCAQCDPSCETCFNTLSTGCLRCPVTSWYNKDNTCTTDCDLDMRVANIEGEFKICQRPCANGEYFYWNRTCQTDCLAPYVTATDDTALYCQPPCTTSEFYYADGVCRSSCPSPMVNHTIIAVTFCNQPCPDGQYLYEDGNCYPTCPSPLNQVSVSDVPCCNKPCPSGEYLYPDGSCQSSCGASYDESVENGVDICVTATGLTSGEKQYIKILSSIYDVGTGTITAGITLSSVIGVSNPGVAFVSGIIKMLPYIRYLKINYPPKLQLMLNDMNSTYISFSFGLNASTSTQEKFANYPIPEKFEEYQWGSSFILNYYSTMTSFAILIAIILFFSVLAFLSKGRYKEFNKWMVAFKLIIKWNFFLMVVCSNLDGIAISSSLQLRTLHLNSVAAVFDLLVCIAHIIFVIFMFGLAIYIITDIRKKKFSVAPAPTKPAAKRINPEARWKEYQLFFKGSKDTSIVRHYFIIPFLLRIVLFYVIIGFLFDYPFAQTIIITSMGALMLVYMLWQKPFVSQLVFVQHCSDETVLLTVNICCLILASFEKFDVGSENDKVVIGNIIIYANILFCFTTNLYLGLYLYNGFKGAYQSTKASGKIGIIAYISSLLSPYESGGMDLDVVPEKENGDNSPLSDGSPSGSPLSSPTMSPIKIIRDDSSPRRPSEFNGGLSIRRSNDTISSQGRLIELPENGSISISSPTRERKLSITSPHGHASTLLLHMPSLESNYNSRTSLWKLKQSRMSMLTTPKVDGEYPQEEITPFSGSPKQKRSFNIMNTPDKSKSRIIEEEDIKDIKAFE